MSTFLNNFFPADTAAMDPIFYPPANGLPSESKLATYMNRQQNVATPTFGLSSTTTMTTGFSLLNLDGSSGGIGSSALAIKKPQQVTPQSPEFIPTRITTSPNFYSPYHTIINGNNPMVKPPSVIGTTQSLLSIQKANAAAVAQQKQLQQQQQQQQHHQQHSQQNHPSMVNGVISSVVTGGGGGNGGSGGGGGQPQQQQQPPSVVTGGGNPSSYVVGLSATTPMKMRNNLLRTDSPAAVVTGGGGGIVGIIGGDDKGQTVVSSRMTPRASPLLATTLPANVHQENVGGTIYFYPTPNHATGPNAGNVVNSVVDPSSVVHHGTPSIVGGGGPLTPVPAGVSLLYNAVPHHVYPGPASNVIGMQPKTQLESAFFLPDEMRSEILARNEISNLILDPVEAAQHSLPMEVDNYHSLYPLEPLQTLHTKLPLSSTYKATHGGTGIRYCLRRLPGFRLQSTKCMTVVEMWKKLQHSNVVQLREIFTTKAFGDNSLVLVYDYYPASETLLSKFFTPPQEPNNYNDPFQGDARPFSHKSNMQRTSNGPLLPEAVIWSIIMQLTAGLRAIHQAGLSCKTVDPTKIIITGKRVRLSFCGTNDIVQFDPNQTNPMTIMHQQDDLTALGRLVLALACRCLQAVQRENVQSSIEMVSRHYSSDLRNFIVFLFTTTQRRSVTDLMPMIGARFYTQLDSLQSQCDMQEDELAKEMENGRLYRILVKLNCINERPDFNMDCTWSETGDRYMLKLFRDYLFHSVTEDGRPWLDHAHIVQCLNKLDCGSMERVQLMSRDEQSVLIVTYAELKSCLENAFSELVENSAAL